MKRLLVLSAALTAGSVAIAAVNSAPADTNNSATDSVKTAEPAKVEAEVSLKAPAAIKVKESAELSVAITPPKGWKVSLEAPMSIKLKSGGKVILGKRKLGLKDGAQAGKDYVVKTTVAGNSAGGDTVKCDATYFMCTDEVCKRFTASRELAVKVN